MIFYTIVLILYNSKDCPPSALEQNISKIRKSVQAIVSEYQHYTGVVSDTIDIGLEHSRSKTYM